METSSLTRYLWHLMILFIPHQPNRSTIKPSTAHKLYSHFDEDEITDRKKTAKEWCNAFLSTAKIIVCCQSEPICFTIIMLFSFCCAQITQDFYELFGEITSLNCFLRRLWPFSIECKIRNQVPLKNSLGLIKEHLFNYLLSTVNVYIQIIKQNGLWFTKWILLFWRKDFHWKHSKGVLDSLFIKLSKMMLESWSQVETLNLATYCKYYSVKT